MIVRVYEVNAEGKKYLPVSMKSSADASAELDFF